jgi:methylamine dehydrogenase accessory protein MauD
VAETGDTQKEPRLEVLLLMLMGIVILLMVAIIGLFLRMNQLQREVLAAVVPLRVEAIRRDSRGLEIGTQAPDFTLPDTAGQMVSLDDFAGQRVLLAFSSTHCRACTEMYPHLKAFSESQPDVQVVMISHGSAEENRQLLEARGFAFPVLPLSVWDDEAMVDYQVPGTPFFYVIDGEGVITNANFANTLEQLEALVEGGGG